MNKLLNYYGEILMNEVRDRVIRQFDMMINGKMKDEESQELYSRIKKLEINEKKLIEDIIPKIVDLTLHDLLCMHEEHTEIELIVEGKNINDESDGLAGELYTEDGWISKFSKERN